MCVCVCVSGFQAGLEPVTQCLQDCVGVCVCVYDGDEAAGRHTHTHTH